jgi:hypothetical protein
MSETNEGIPPVLADIYADIPKPVLATILVSLALEYGVAFDNLQDTIALRWGTLHHQGFIKKMPTACARNMARRELKRRETVKPL